ncbi:hypothetical protein MYX65_07110 [Acidobacteria bacterium AH-259-L09]|nr:hypothetical protein [Acidobacteria bacterium AH-259-L09]
MSDLAEPAALLANLGAGHLVRWKRIAYVAESESPVPGQFRINSPIGEPSTGTLSKAFSILHEGW